MDKIKLALMLAIVVPSTSFASGGVHCQKADDKLPPIGLSWGVGHVIGSGRISPYSLTLSGREILINDPTDASHVRQKQNKSAETIPLIEVGYWNDEDMIQVRLADEQLLKNKLLLSVIKSKISDGYQGFLTVTDLSGVTIEKVFVRCSKE